MKRHLGNICEVAALLFSKMYVNTQYRKNKKSKSMNIFNLIFTQHYVKAYPIHL